MSFFSTKFGLRLQPTIRTHHGRWRLYAVFQTTLGSLGLSSPAMSQIYFGKPRTGAKLPQVSLDAWNSCPCTSPVETFREENPTNEIQTWETTLEKKNYWPLECEGSKQISRKQISVGLFCIVLLINKRRHLTRSVFSAFFPRQFDLGKNI